MTWETIENRKKFTSKLNSWRLWRTSAIQDETDRRVASGNTTLIVLVHFSDLKLRVLISNIKSKTANVQIFFLFIFSLKHCFSPVHLWVAKYSCISVWNDWETISRWHTRQLRRGGSALRQQATRPIDWVHLKGILAQKKRGGKCWKKEKDHDLFSTCWCMHAASNSRCFICCECVWREKGLIWRGVFLAGCCCCWTATVAPAKRLCGCSTGKRGTSLIILEWTEIGCKAEMLCLGQAGAELWSANKLGSCAAVLHYWHPCTAVWKHLLPHLLYKPFGNKLKENP